MGALQFEYVVIGRLRRCIGICWLDRFEQLEWPLLGGNADDQLATMLALPDI